MAVMNPITLFLQKNLEKRLRIAIIGDCMLDEYYQVKIERISPEGPFPIALSQSVIPHMVRPGGAGNVAYQFKNFNADVYLFGFLDKDAEKVYKEAGIDTRNCTRIDAIPRKRRFYDGETQYHFRWDIEDTKADPAALKSFQKETVKKIKALGKIDAIICSDYAKGVFTSTSFLGSLRGTPIIVDPKKDWKKWKNIATIFKPNSEETRRFVPQNGTEKEGAYFKRACKEMQKELRTKGVIVTRGGNAVVGIEKTFFEYKPTQKVSPASIIGAGDCFMALTALCIGHEFSLRKSAEVAYEGTSLSVQKKMNDPLSPVEMQKASKFIVHKETLRNRKYKLVFTNGCFDILHVGHLELLNFARSKGDKLIVAVNSDASVRRLPGKSGRPIVALEERMQILAGLECVDYVISFDENTPIELIRELHPDVLVKGGDYTRSTVVGEKLVKDVVICPFIEGRSTTKIIEKIKKDKK